MNVEPKTIIKCISITETGEHPQQYRFKYSGNEISFLDTAVIEDFNDGIKILPKNFVGHSKEIIDFVRSHSDVSIPNGWGAKRFSFVIECYHQRSFGVGYSQYIMGYSDCARKTDGEIDPDVKFYINSSISVKEVIEQTPYGLKKFYHAYDNDQFLFTEDMDKNPQWCVRPADILSGLQMDVFSAINEVLGTVIDSRNRVSPVPKRSNRLNNIAPYYLASIFDTYRHTNSYAHFGMDRVERLAWARRHVAEESIWNDLFIRMLCNNAQVGVEPNSFTWGELMKFVNEDTIIEETNLWPEKSTRGLTPVEWDEESIETSIAVLLRNAVPAILGANGISSIRFSTENFVRDLDSPVFIMEASYFGNVLRDDQINDRIQTQIYNEIFNDRFKEVKIKIEASVNLVGESWFKISAEGKESKFYTFPTYCDALMSPVIVDSAEDQFNICRGIDTILEAVFY